jgi:hypothetical protein
MSVPAYKTIKALRNGETVDLGGIYVTMATDGYGNEAKIGSGDLYIAERNSGPKFLTAKEIDEGRNLVVPTTKDYLFDIPECVKVVEAI